MNGPSLWIIPALPLAAVALNMLIGDRLGRRGTAWLACGAVGVAFVFAVRSVITLAGMPAAERMLVDTVYTWMAVGAFSVNVSFALDPLTSVMVLVVTGVGFLIHVYSVGYMAHDASYRRYVLYRHLFMFSMLTLVLADNFLLMFVGWEGVGLCSYLLIGFWYERPAAAEAGKKAFIVNRIGDFAFILGMLLIWVHTGSLNFAEVMHTAPQVFAFGSIGITAVCLLLFIGATGKSAQIPLFTWLPDAMEGPTPVSALIHAATMVTAGVYMVARCYVLFELAPFALATVAIIGAATALLAATIGLAQNDIKRVLAYSTVSQLGYMFMALGVGAFTAGIFHLMTHAFFKALLFLGAGSVIHALHEEQDMRKMGGLAKHLPWTHGTMLVATIAIAGIPPLAGFFSKDEILHGAFASGNYGIWLVGILGAVLTAFYMFRLYFLTFRGPTRMSAEVQARVHESPRVMVLPLAVLAVLSVIGGWIGPPMIEGGNAFHRWLEPVFNTHIVHVEQPDAMPGLAQGGVVATFAQHEDQAGDAHAVPGDEHAAAGDHGGGHEVPRSTEIGLIMLSVLAGVIGIFFAWRFYLNQPELSTRLRERWSALHKLLLNKYWVDELYDAVVVRPIHGLSQGLWKIFDTKIVDGAVNGVGYTFEGLSAVLRLFQTGFVGTYAFFFALGVAALLLHFLR